MFDKIKAKGFIEITSYDKNNEIDGFWQEENLITDIGINYIAKMLGGDVTGINKIGLGTSNTVASTSNTSLFNRVILVDTTRDYSVDKKVRFLSLIPANTFGTTQVYREIGLIYKNFTEDILITRAVFITPIQQKFDSSLSISYSLSITSV